MSKHAGECSIRAMCKALGVARSGYCRWRSQGGITQHAQADAELTEQIRTVFEHSGQTYAAPRVYAELKAQGLQCSRRRMARLMRAAQLSAKPPRRRAQTTQNDGQHHCVGNLLAREFTASAHNRKSLIANDGM